MRAFPPWIARAAFLVKLAVLAAAGSGAPNLPMCSGLLLGLLSISALGIRSRMPHRVLYPLEAAVDVLQAVCACSLFHALYPTVSGASPQRALSCMLVGNGVLALALRSQLSALPFKWRLPTLLATSAALLAHTASLCSSALLQHGFRTLHTLARTLLPVLCPAFIDLMPPDGPGALLAPAPPTSAEGAALCAAYQAPSVLLGCVALACHLCAAEAAARKAEQGAARSAH